jgi:hypothetical protein
MLPVKIRYTLVCTGQKVAVDRATAECTKINILPDLDKTVLGGYTEYKDRALPSKREAPPSCYKK